MGSHLCRRLSGEGHHLTILCRPTSRLDQLDGLEFKKVIGDVTIPGDVEKAVDGCDAVFHAAANLSYWGRQKEVLRSTNIAGTKNVVAACLSGNVGKLVHVSSVAAVGIPEKRDSPASEDFRFNLAGLPYQYHNSKKQAEEVVLAAIENGLNAVIVNPAAIWGPHGGAYRGSEIVRKVRRSRIVPYFTGGICVVHVDDVVDGIVKAFDRGKSGERYILGSENVTLKEVAMRAAEKQSVKIRLVPVPSPVTFTSALAFESLALLTKKRPHITFTTHRCAGRFHYYDSGKAKRELGFSPKRLDQILDDCIAFTTRHSESITAGQVVAGEV